MHILIRFLMLLSLLLTGCSSFSPETRRADAYALASTQHWQPLRLATSEFVLAAFAPATLFASKRLTVYIEGDGLAWLTPSLASDDPTPRQAIALQLALAQPQGAAAYLARPCQYTEGDDRRMCDKTFWTERRFAPEVIDATNQAINQLKIRYQAEQLVLVGYSGGGAVAALVAARRNDVIKLMTVAGNLEPVVWAQLHQLSPLTGSLNPADAWPTLQGIAQIHWVGGKDRNITPDIAAAYRARFPAARQPEIRVIADFDHSCCWLAQWPTLWAENQP